MDLASIALQGLAQAEIQLEQAAQAIVSAGTASAQSPVDTVDLSAAMVALMTAKNSYSVNLATIKTADQLQKSLIDITA